jgi:hypothetical protein
LLAVFAAYEYGEDTDKGIFVNDVAWKLAGALCASWCCVFVMSLSLMKKKYWATFFSTEVSSRSTNFHLTSPGLG